MPNDSDELPENARQQLDDLFRSDPLMDQLGANFLRGGHGGIMFSLGDIAMSFASNGYGRQSVATQIDISYHRGVRPGDTITATASEISRTRRFAHHRVELIVDDRLVASATGTTYRTDEWILGPDIWPDEWREKY